MNILEKLDTARNIEGYTKEDLHASFYKRRLIAVSSKSDNNSFLGGMGHSPWRWRQWSSGNDTIPGSFAGRGKLACWKAFPEAEEDAV